MYTKYPRTYHLPWSKGVGGDDKTLSSFNQFFGRRIIVTEKMDGENFSLYQDYLHARSIDSGYHPSRTWIKSFWSQIQFKIPQQWKVCGENLFAKHSIHYTNLPCYFLGYSVWNEDNTCLSWKDTLMWFEKLGVTPVPTIFDGTVFTKKQLHDLWMGSNEEQQEGYVVRIADEFPYEQFTKMVGKYVRKQHVQTEKHWISQMLVKNETID